MFRQFSQVKIISRNVPVLPGLPFSDTFTITGNVIEKIMEKDGLIKYFKERYYSDVTGCKKAEGDVMKRIEMIDLRNFERSSVLTVFLYSRVPLW